MGLYAVQFGKKTCVIPLESMMWALIVISFLHPICAAAVNRHLTDDSDSSDQSTYEPSMYYKMYASHYEVTTYEYTYPRVHADAISYSSYEADSPVYITTSSRPRLINKHAKMGVVHASYTKVPKAIDSRDLL
ncbi:uncharacterized protein LOC123476812 [Daphnia magna]|uniref:uncharacterized protein LOC116932214 n=1 Tax=Daphnia magna TaxID=35525 RepID=UPI001E1BDEC6|nr:uncharacterized protein LOC116932214 [Daphnia magna]XP_045035490.1 uncharacterized protein LOC123476812 [Daphnia magna]